MILDLRAPKVEITVDRLSPDVPFVLMLVLVTFWLTATLLAWVYFGYPFVVYVMSRVPATPVRRETYL